MLALDLDLDVGTPRLVTALEECEHEQARGDPEGHGDDGPDRFLGREPWVDQLGEQH